MSRLVVMCVDSLFTSDIEEIKKLKGFGTILEKAAIYEHIKCIYPTLTYPCHSSIITGCLPNKHGICHNEKLDPITNNQNWYWDYKDIKVDTLFTHAKKAGLKVASVQWPVSANAPVDYLIPEIWPCKYQKDMSDYLIENGTDSVKDIVKKHAHLLDWKENPNFDNFSVTCAVDIIHQFKPDVLFMHQAHLDHIRHVHGVHAIEVQDALRYHDKWIQKIITALQEENLFEDTHFIILGDHGQMQVDYNICPNVLLEKEGFITVDEQDNIKDWQVYIQSCGISAQVFIQNKDAKVITKVEEIMQSLQNLGYVRDILTKQQVEELYGLTGEFSYVLEASPNYAFGNTATGNLIVETDTSDYKFSVATHGHRPERGDKPCFIVRSEKIAPGRYSNARLIDEMPTMLKLLDIPFDKTQIDGKELF